MTESTSQRRITKAMEPGNTDCPVCCEKFNKSTHAKITCEFGDCNYETCKACTRTYILNTTLDPHCMDCRKNWSKDFVVQNLNNSWIQKEYRAHRKKLLLDREISKIPDTIPVAERELLCSEINSERETVRQERLKLAAQMHDLSKKERQCARRIRDIRSHKDDQPQRRTFIMPCQNDDCRGFISNSYKCELCKMFTCSKCHDLLGLEKDAEHVCKEENVKSVEAIRENTKPCPKCGTRIQKIDGCDQMWCPQDQVAFSWRTGQIDNGVVHNPHYYEYERQVNNGQIPRNPGDNPCNQMCSQMELRLLNRQIQTHLEKFPVALANNLLNSMKLISKWITNLWWIVQQTFRNRLHYSRHTVNYFETNLTRIRVKYINNEISKEALATNVLKLDKTRAKELAKVQIYDLILEIAKEHFNTLASAKEQKELEPQIKSVCDFCVNIQSILVYFNDEMRKISVAHNGTVEQLESREINAHPRGIYLSNQKFNKKTLNDKNTIDKEPLIKECDVLSYAILQTKIAT